jgi:hypothetical protein
MSDAEAMVSFSDPKVEIDVFERYKGRKGYTDRIAFISSALLHAKTYYFEGQGGKKAFFRQPKDPTTAAYVQARLGEPTQRFGLVIFQYTTDEKGELLDPTKLKGRVKLWSLTETKFLELSEIDKSWKLLDQGFGAPQHDLKVKCTNDDFQKMDLHAQPGAEWKKNEKWYRALKAKEIKAKEKLRQAMGKELKDVEIMALLGGPSNAPTSGGDQAGDIDLSDIGGVDDTPIQSVPGVDDNNPTGEPSEVEAF